MDFVGIQLGIPQAAHRVVFVQALMRLGGGLDVPGDQPGAEGLGQLLGQHGLAGTRLALDQQRALQGDGGIHRELEVIGGDVGLGAFELHQGILGRIAPVGKPDGSVFGKGLTITRVQVDCERRTRIQSLNGRNALSPARRALDAAPGAALGLRLLFPP
ncbi:hypothetical protein D9M68_766810 [compost metagenome]